MGADNHMTVEPKEEDSAPRWRNTDMQDPHDRYMHVLDTCIRQGSDMPDADSTLMRPTSNTDL